MKKERTSGITALSGDSFLKANGSTALQQKRSAMSWSGVTVFRGRFLITAPRTKYLKPNWIGSIKAIHVSHSWTTISIICHKIFFCQCSTCYCNLLITIKGKVGCNNSIINAVIKRSYYSKYLLIQTTNRTKQIIKNEYSTTS